MRRGSESKLIFRTRSKRVSPSTPNLSTGKVRDFPLLRSFARLSSEREKWLKNIKRSCRLLPVVRRQRLRTQTNALSPNATTRESFLIELFRTPIHLPFLNRCSYTCVIIGNRRWWYSILKEGKARSFCSALLYATKRSYSTVQFGR